MDDPPFVLILDVDKDEQSIEGTLALNHKHLEQEVTQGEGGGGRGREGGD